MKVILLPVFLFLVNALLAQDHKTQVIQKDTKPQNSIGEMSKAEELALKHANQDKTTSCSNAISLGAVVLQDCNNVGTPAFYQTGTDVNMTNVGGCTAPTVAEQCANANGYTAAGTWVRVNPDPGVETIDIQIASGTVAGGNHEVFIQFFQGSCASLTPIGCHSLCLVTMGVRIPENIHQEGIDDTQDVWMYIWDDSGLAFNVNAELIGSGAAPVMLPAPMLPTTERIVTWAPVPNPCGRVLQTMEKYVTAERGIRMKIRCSMRFMLPILRE